MDRRLLSIIASIRPEIWDAIYPHGPVIGYAQPVAGIAATRFDRVALNPQPLPPREEFLVGAAYLAKEIARIAIETEARGESSYSFVSEVVDDWCGTSWPGKFPFPVHPHVPDPDPAPWDVIAGRVVAAIVFTSIADRITDDKFSAIFADAADRLIAAASPDRTVGTTKARNTTAVKKTRR